MRCPYCGGLNPDKNTFCSFCGRDMQPPARPTAGRQYPPVQQPRSAPQPSQPSQAPQGRPASMPQAPSPPARPAAPRIPLAPPPPPAPEPPAPFPPRTLAELQALEQGALAYSVVESSVGDGQRKTVRIVYPKGVAWQQVATLLKALREQQDGQFESIIIQGVLEQNPSVYAFTNGQLCFDRNTRLGDLISNRYQIETGNGFESDAVRIVLSA